MSGSTAGVVVGSEVRIHNVFVYGSLLADEVVRVLLNRIPQSSPAILHGFHRFSIRGRVYPAILPAQNKSVSGKVLFSISDRELFILDTFEDDEYERTSVTISLMDDPKMIEAHTYVWGNRNDPNLYGEWNFEEWRKAHMNDFIRMTTGFMQELEQPKSKPRVATYESYFQEDGNGDH